MTSSVDESFTPEDLTEARRYTQIIQWSDRDQVFVITVPELPGCRTHGATHAEAIEMGEEAIATWLAGARHYGQDIPPPAIFPDTRLPTAAR